jgi:hypothetical protein
MQLDFRTRPLQYFEQLDRNGKRNLILYALRSASAQLALIHHLSTSLSDSTITNDVVMFTAKVFDPKGRTDSAVGAVSLKGLSGKEFADAIMAAQTKAKRRAILDMVGSGMLDESEVEGMHGSVVPVDTTGMSSSYVPIPAAPVPVPSSSPAIEIRQDQLTEAVKKSCFSPDPPFETWPMGKTLEVTVEGPSIDPAITAAADSLVARIIENTAAAVKAATQPTEQEITSRLNSYRRDTLSQGGMKPSKGFGIAAKWSKLLTKFAPNKTIEEYQTLLTRLDYALAERGPAGVVAAIEQEIS